MYFFNFDRKIQEKVSVWIFVVIIVIIVIAIV